MEIIKEQKLTQKEIAKRAGRTQQISKIETVNSPTPNLDTFIKYINVLGFKFEIYVGEQGAKVWKKECSDGETIYVFYDKENKILL